MLTFKTTSSIIKKQCNVQYTIYLSITVDYAKVLATCTHLIIAIFKYTRDDNIQKDVVNEWFFH